MVQRELETIEQLVVQIMPDPKGYADKVINQLLEKLTMGTPVSPTIEEPEKDYQIPYEQLAARNLLLAAALGACECWGENTECEYCKGVGSTGWIDPEEDLLRELVGPALQIIQTKEQDDLKSPIYRDVKE